MRSRSALSGIRTLGKSRPDARNLPNAVESAQNAERCAPMPLRIVNSKQNPRVKELRRALSHPARQGRDLAGIEGPHLVEEALLTGREIECIFVAQGAEHLLEPMPIPPGTEILLLPQDILAAVLDTESPQPIAALIRLPDWTWQDLLCSAAGAAPLVLVLAGLQDPGNLGTIIRSAEAFGATGILALPGTVSGWNPKAVRASAGSVLRLPVLVAGKETALPQLRNAGLRIWATAAHGSRAADCADLVGPAALIVGNEGAGVPADLAGEADGSLTIPCPGAVESLNAAVAASILLYEASRQRASQSHRRTPREAP